MIKMIGCCLLLTLTGHQTHSQSKTPWNGKRCAVVLTYDDALNVHLDNVIPALDSLQLKGTFYLSGYFPGCRERLTDWRKAAANGQELANHTLFHPCTGDMPGREFVPADYKLNRYSIRRMVDETRMTNVFLEALDGQKKRTFAFTCGDMKIGDTSFMDFMKNDFVAARAVRSEMVTIDKVDLYNISCFAINGATADQLTALVKQAIDKNALLVFLFHGVGGEHALNVSLEAHSRLIHFLKENKGTVWTTTMLQAATYVQQFQSNKN